MKGTFFFILIIACAMIGESTGTHKFLIYCLLSRCSITRGSNTGFFHVGPTKVKACKSFLFTKSSLKVWDKEHLFDFICYFLSGPSWAALFGLCDVGGLPTSLVLIEWLSPGHNCHTLFYLTFLQCYLKLRIIGSFVNLSGLVKFVTKMVMVS